MNRRTWSECVCNHTGIDKKTGRGGTRPNQPPFNPEKGGELMENYTLEVELLEEMIAPLGARVGSG